MLPMLARSKPWLLALIAAFCLAPAPAVATAEMRPGPDDPWPAIREAFLAGDLDEALARLERRVAAHPTDRMAHYYMAMIRWRQGDIPAAAASYRQVLALDPDGPFGKDAKLWLDAHAARGQIAPVAPPAKAPPRRPISLRPSPRSSVVPRLTTVVTPFRPAARPVPRPSPSGRARSAKPRPGYFKAADGTFEFKPPAGFVLLDEGLKGEEAFTLFGGPGAMAGYATGQTPPTLLVTWRVLDELKPLKPDQRAARERQLLAREIEAYGPDARIGAYAGGPAFRVHQAQGDWEADTLVFFQHGRLYAMTYGGAKSQLGAYRGRVEASWRTAIFHP